jgi:hypothetical protein
MKRRIYVLALLSLAQVAVASGEAFAQPAGGAPAPQAEAGAKAEAFFQEGIRAVAQKQWADAEGRFLAAWALNPSYDVAANLGQTQYRLGKYREAAQHLAYAAKSWPLVGKKEPRELAEKRLAELRALLGSLTIAVDVPGATVLVDGTAIGRSPVEMEVFVDPGAHTVEAKLDGYDDAKVMVDVGKGAKASPTLKMVRRALVQGEAAAPATPVVEKRPMWPAIVGGGVGGVLLIGGIAFTVASNGHRADSRSLQQQIDATGRGCVNGANGVTCGKLDDALSKTDTARKVAITGYVGAGALVAGTVAYLWWPAPQKRTGADVRVLPMIGRVGSGLQLEGEF